MNAVTKASRTRKQIKYVDSIDKKVINKSVYPNVCSGFTDTNPAVREQTVKSMLFIGPKLNDQNLNMDLMKHFARLQAKDDQAPIRCNTTICLGKLLSYLNKETKTKVMGSAFNRAMRDPFPPARQAGLNAILANADEYSLPDLAMKMLPGVTPLLCDKEKNVRQTALKAARQFLTKIEEASNDPEKERQLLGLAPNESLPGAKQVSDTAVSSGNTGPQTAAEKAQQMASGWMSSAYNYASDKVGKKETPKPQTLNQMAVKSSTQNGILQPTKNVLNSAPANQSTTSSNNKNNANYNLGDGWDKNIDDDDENSDYDDGWGDNGDDDDSDDNDVI